MATRCTISMKGPDSYKTIRCAWEGGVVKGVGEMLVKHYKSARKIRDLMSLGDLMWLGKNPICTPNYWGHPKRNSYSMIYKDDGTNPACVESSTSKDFYKHLKEVGYSKNYLYDNGAWFLIDADNQMPRIRVSTILKPYIKSSYEKKWLIRYWHNSNLKSAIVFSDSAEDAVQSFKHTHVGEWRIIKIEPYKLKK